MSATNELDPFNCAGCGAHDRRLHGYPCIYCGYAPAPDLLLKLAAAIVGPESQATRDVLAERRRQVDSEGWTPEHDDRHRDGSMALAAACYASNAATWANKGTAQLREKYPELSLSFRWPWSREWWKPKNQRRDLVRAAALILAEIERLDRAAAISSEREKGAA